MSGPSLATMAWRNLWRNRRRTVITLASFAFGVLIAVLFTGLGDSSYGKMIELAARTGSGHVSFQHPEYQDAPSFEKSIGGVGGLRELALADERVERVTTRIFGPAMLASAGNSFGTLFMAVDPGEEDAQTLSIAESLVDGAMFESADDKGIILGAVLAENLGLRMGRRVVYTMTDREGEIVSGLARVSGIVRTGSPSVDGALCLLPIGTVREALGYGDDEATSVAVFLRDQRGAAEVADAFGATVSDDVAALTWQQTQPELAGFIAADSAGTVVFEVILLILIAAGIFNSLFVSVMERLREFGIMLAIGFTPWQVFGIVTWESLWLGAVGLVVAAIVTIGPYWHLHTEGLDYSAMIGEQGTEVSGVVLEPILYADIQPEKLVTIAVVVLLTTLVAGLYPAWKAGRVEPVEAIKLV